MFEVNSSRGNYKVIVKNTGVETLDYLDCFKNALYVCDEKFFNAQTRNIQGMLEKQRILLIKNTEDTKDYQSIERVILDLIQKHKFKRSETLVAFGGGAIQDITGFIASILYRGVPWVFVPTTLISQGDSCIGGKTSINLGELKNCIGTFYPPTEVICCPEFLLSLPKREIVSGIGEILHYYMLFNSHLKELEEDYEKLKEKDSSLLFKHVRYSLSLKKPVIEQDEFDKDIRNLFNYGHTFGHAIEGLTKYQVLHGEAVAVGMDIANYVSFHQHFINLETYEKISKNLSLVLKDVKTRVLLEIKEVEDDSEHLVNLLLNDKKGLSIDFVTCILPTKDGFKKINISKLDISKHLIGYFTEGNVI